MSDSVLHVSDSEFNETVIKANGPVLVDYWAEWCGPCKMIAPVLDAIAEDYAGKLTVVKINIDENPQTPQHYGVQQRTVYILPHSHFDVGYTDIQTNIEQKQVNNLLTGIEFANKTKDYPAGSKFVWNLEGTYAADLFLERMNEQQKSSFFEAVKNGQVAINGMFLNTLTGLCRPEELLQPV